VSLTPKYAPIAVWCALSGIGRSSTYDWIGKGVLKAKKAGTRTLIDVEHGLEQIGLMPDAEIKPATRRRASSVIARNDTREAAKPEPRPRGQTGGGEPSLGVAGLQHEPEQRAEPPPRRHRPVSAQPVVAG
jgi:hypothetical protein